MGLEEEWEYLSMTVDANITHAGARDFIGKHWPQWTGARKYSPETMGPQLNAYGKQGWELVHMEPVALGENDDVRFGGGDNNMRWSNSYFCVFKRRLVK